MEGNIYCYRNLEFVIPSLGGDGVVLSNVLSKHGALPYPLRSHPIVQNIGTKWDQSNLSERRAPIHVGNVAHPDSFSMHRALRILDMPIKFPGTEYRLPIEVLPYIDTIATIRKFEAVLNPNIDRYYTYLTLDQGFVNRGATQRNKGYHVDGFQGARVQSKVEVGHSYIVSDSTPTVFAIQPFNVEHLDEAKHNLFLEFDRQANVQTTWRPSPYQIMLVDAYTVHKAALVEVSGYRTFFRLSFSVREFDRLGNTPNPLFDYDWEMVVRDVGHALKMFEGG